MPENIKVGVINVAVGGASINLYDEDKTTEYISKQADWFKNFCKEYDNQPMRRLMECAKRAQKVGVIKGILLHQGCTDNGQKDWPERVKLVYNRMLKELNLKAEDCPLLVGELMTQEDGKAGNLTDIDRLTADINLDARADNISFLQPALGLDKNTAVIDVIRHMPDELPQTVVLLDPDLHADGGRVLQQAVPSGLVFLPGVNVGVIPKRHRLNSLGPEGVDAGEGAGGTAGVHQELHNRCQPQISYHESVI